MELNIKKVQELIDEGVIFPPLDGNHGEKHPKTSDYVDEGIPFILVPDLVDGVVDLEHCNHITKAQASTLNKGISKTGDVLFTHKATIGKVALVDTKAYEYIVLTPQVTYYRIKDPAILDNKYLYYYFKSNYFQDTFKLFASSGGTRDYLGIVAQRKLPIIFPSISIQKNIVSILSPYDDLISNNNKRIKILEQMAEKLYKEWFVRFRFPGHEKAEFVDGVPKRWKIDKLDEYVYIRAGGDRPKIYSDIPTGNCAIPIFSNGIENDGLYGYTEKPIIEKESITISARGTVGFVCLRRVPFCPIVRLLALTPKQDHVTAIFLYYLLKNDELIGNGTSQQQITIPMVKKKKFLKPVSCLIKQFTEFADQCWNEIDVLKQQNQNLIKQRDYLLPRLMSGKLQV